MKLIIDYANLDEIKELYEYYPVDGVTTNPSILAKEKRNPYDILTAIRDFIGKDTELHVQVISLKADDMINEATIIQERLGKNTFIKVPVTREGLKAMRGLKERGALVTATAVYTHMQAFLAAKTGVDYVAPYVNRIDNLGADGVRTTKEIHDMLKNNHLSTEVLAASFKNSQQTLELARHGIGAATIAPDVIEGFLKIDIAIRAVDDFTKEFEDLCGKGKTMKDC